MNLNFSAIGKLDDSEKGSGQVVGGRQQQHISKDVDNSRIILGIDPGTNVMGYGVLKVTGNKAELVVMGVIDMRRQKDIYLRLGKIFDRVTGIIDEYLPDEMAIEAPFFGKNVQSMLKLGRAQGVAIAAAIHHSVPIHEYAPLKIKMAITGNGPGFEGAGGGYAATSSEPPRRPTAAFPGCYRRSGCGLLPFPTAWQTRDGSTALWQLERFRDKEQREDTWRLVCPMSVINEQQKQFVVSCTWL